MHINVYNVLTNRVRTLKSTSESSGSGVTSPTPCQWPVFIGIVGKREQVLGDPRKNQRSNKLYSSILKPKNLVTLFVNCSCNSLFDLCFFF